MGGGKIALRIKLLAKCLYQGFGSVLPVIGGECTSVRCSHLERHIERISRVGSRVTLVRHPVVLASGNVIFRNCKVAEVVRCFDNGSDETGRDVVLDVAMEEPDSGVVGPETPHG